MSLALSLVEQRRVLGALLLREIKTRFGHSRMGYIWGFFEPTMHVLMFIMIWELVGRMGPNGVEPILFLITGIVPFLMIRSTAKQVMTAVKSNKALLVFPQINMLDFCLARAILEFCTYGAIFVIMLYGCSFFGVVINIENLLGVMFMFIVIWIFGFGLGLFLLPVLAAFPITNTVYGITMRLMYFTSGVFISIQHKIPADYHEYLSWNPILQLMEIFRDEFFVEITASPILIDLDYLVAYILLLWLAGLVLQKKMRRQILEG